MTNKKKEVTKVESNIEKDKLDKELKTEDNIITRHTNKETRQFNFGTALLELENSVKERDLIIGRLESRVMKLEDAMAFFSDWWEKTYGKSIIVPTNEELNLFKK